MKRDTRFLLRVLVLIVLHSSYSISVAQTDSTLLYKKRKTKVAVVGTAGIVIPHLALNQLWYKDYPRSSFHFINDNKEWLFMDKLGHAYSSYYLGLMGIKAAKWAGHPKKKAIILGGLYGTFFQTPIEIQDGFSTNWGASIGDILANSTGTLLVIGQELLWDEQRIQLKYSYTPTNYAAIRPNVLGNGIQEEFLKDYNGQTYWLSANINSFINRETKIPDWVNLSFGYGANGMIGGHDNIWLDQDQVLQNYESIKRYRQFYLSPDIDFTRIKTSKKGLKALFIVLNAFKFPMPAIELSNSKLKMHWLKF